MKLKLMNILAGALIGIPLLLLLSCSDDKNSEGPGTESSFKITSADAGVTVSDDGSTAWITVPPTGGAIDLNITANSPWTLSDRDDDWCVLTGTGERITVSAPELASDYTRKTMIRILVDGFVAGHLYVSQDGTEVAALELDKTELVFPETGGSETVAVVSNKDWTVTGYEGLDWIDIDQGPGYFNVTTVRNDVPFEFTTTLTVTAGSESNYKTKDIRVTLEPWTSVYIGLERDMIVIPEDGGEVRIEVFTNREWKVTSSASWLTAVRDGNEVVITAPQSSSGNLEADLKFETTSGKDHAELVLPVRQYTDPFILEYTVTSQTLSVAAPLVGEVNCYVDWGDGNSSSYAGYSSQYGEPAISHVYESAGVYQVKMYGSCQSIATYPTLERDQRESITAIKAWGSLGFTDLFNAFSGTSITEIPDGYQDIFRNATDLSSLFSDCTRLVSVPGDLLNDLQVTQLSSIFFGCTSLREIPVTIFNGTNLIDAPSIFRECSSLKTIPEGLFDGQVNLQNLLCAFTDCVSLESVPVNIFDDCREITNLYRAFEGCTAWRGSSPYTMIEGDPVHLYERENYPGDFAAPSSFGSCFENCLRLEDYSAIPSDWK